MKHLNLFFKHNFRNNWGLWAHLFASIIGAKAFFVFFLWSAWFTILAVLVIAICWEFIELSLDYGFKLEQIRKNYGSVTIWIYDSIGDILIAVIGAAVVVL